jgi:glucose-1-phosphate thymidylyltransferase
MTRVREAVILARGLGTRMRAAGPDLDAATAAVADAGLKALIPFERPFLDYVLHDLAEAGIRRAVVVIGPEHEAMRDYCRALATSRLEVALATQESARGTADAVLAAERAVDGSFIAINGDNRYPLAALRALAEQGAPALVGFLRSGLLQGNIPAARIGRFAAISAGDDGMLERIIEKPSAAQLAACGADPAMSMNCWAFDQAIFAACRAVTRSVRGELELPDAVALLVSGGTRFAIVRSREAVLDLSSREDIASVRAALAGVAVRL